MSCGLWFYHLTFCHVNLFCCMLPSEAIPLASIFSFYWRLLEIIPSILQLCLAVVS